MPHHRVWLFRPPAGSEDEFRRAYSADGPWAEVFRQGAGYLGSRLLGPAEADGWWMTIDSWADGQAFETFQSQHRADYERLDEELEGVAGEERFVGAFDD